MNEQPKRKMPVWAFIVIIGIVFILYYTMKDQPSEPNRKYQQSTQKSEKENIKILSHTSKEHGYGVNVYVEIKNTASKELRFVGLEITWYDQNGRILESGVGTQTNVAPYETAVVDRYFDEKPSGATYKIRVDRVTY